jgi:hypothetical protein
MIVKFVIEVLLFSIDAKTTHSIVFMLVMLLKMSRIWHEAHVASSDTEAELRNHVTWLQSRDVTKMTVCIGRNNFDPGILNIYRELLILE